MKKHFQTSLFLKKTLQRSTLLRSNLRFTPLTPLLLQQKSSLHTCQFLLKKSPSSQSPKTSLKEEEDSSSQQILNEWVTALHDGNLSAVQRILQSTPQIAIEQIDATASTSQKQFKVTPLLVAAQNGYWLIVKEILSSLPRAVAAEKDNEKDGIAAYLNFQDEFQGYSALHSAIYAASNVPVDVTTPPETQNWYRCVQIMAQHPACDLNARAMYTGYTPLLLASRSGLTSIVDLLLQNGASIDLAGTKYQESSLHLAAEFNQADTLVVLAAHAVANNQFTSLTAKDVGGTTFLDIIDTKKQVETPNYATMQILAEAVKDLIGRSENGSLPPAVVEVTKKVWQGHQGEEVQDFTGNTSLMVAAFRGELETVQKLAATSKQLARNKFGWNALLWSLIHSGPRVSYSRDIRKEIVKVLLPKTSMEECTTVDDSNALQMSFPNPDIVRLLLEQQFVKDINVKSSNYGSTPLLQLIESTVQQRLDVMTVLEVMEELLHNGASVNEAANDGTTPLLLACSRGLLPIVQILTERCGVNPGDKAHIHAATGANPVVAAASANHWPIALYLMEQHKLSPNVSINNGTYPLFFALTSGNADLVKTLVDKFKADVNFCNKKTNVPPPLVFAIVSTGNLDLVEFLLQRGADPTLKDGQGFNALDYTTFSKEAAEQQKTNPQAAKQVQYFDQVISLLQKYTK